MLIGIRIASIHMGSLKMFRKVNSIIIRPRMEARSFRFMFMAYSILVRLTGFCFAQKALKYYFAS